KECPLNGIERSCLFGLFGLKSPGRPRTSPLMRFFAVPRPFRSKNAPARPARGTALTETRLVSGEARYDWRQRKHQARTTDRRLLNRTDVSRSHGRSA